MLFTWKTASSQYCWSSLSNLVKKGSQSCLWGRRITNYSIESSHVLHVRTDRYKHWLVRMQPQMRCLFACKLLPPFGACRHVKRLGSIKYGQSAVEKDKRRIINFNIDHLILFNVGKYKHRLLEGQNEGRLGLQVVATFRWRPGKKQG